MSKPKPISLHKLRTLLEPILIPGLPHPSCFAPFFELLTGANLLKLGQQLHAHMLLRGIQFNSSSFLAAKMVAFYASSGDLDSAVILFNKSENPSPLLYNSIIRAYTRYGLSAECVDIYCRMQRAGFHGDNFTLPFVFKCCTELSRVWMGKCAHGQCLRIGFAGDKYVGTSLIDMYVKCGELKYANQMFDEMSVRDSSSWNALINGYMKSGDIGAAEELFGRMKCRNIVSWTAMVSGYAQNGLADKALTVFDEMLAHESEIKPNWVTVMSVLPACAHVVDLDRGRRIHDYVRKIGLESNASVKIALAAMYAKCGSLVDARTCFDKLGISERTLVAWNTIITAYASHGHGMEAVSAFKEMLQSGIWPDCVTFVGLLIGCSHAGLINEGLEYFHRMRTVYSLEPKIEHYGCVVDLLGRAGRLKEAKELVDQMPMKPGPSIWGSLLAASRKNRNLAIAEMAAKELFVLEPENSANYVLLSNMYAELGMWKEVDRLRKILKSQGMKKSPGGSWIEFNGKSHLFLSGDTSHPQAKEIYMLLEALPDKIKAAGYIPNTIFSLHDVSEEEKELSLATHSEKLAIAFGLLNTDPGVILRVTKNLRICGDCHTVIKFISKIYDREIIVRDLNRFHRFRDGVCSCRDFW